MVILDPQNKATSYIKNITDQIVAESGIPSDKYHLGKIILKCLRDDPAFLLQIDGATGEMDTFGSILEKSVRCALAFRNFGIKRGDVIVLMTSNCLDLSAAMYASFYLGVGAACVDRYLQKDEIVHIFKDTKPKFVFCMVSTAPVVEEALRSLELDSGIATFGKQAPYNTFPEFLQRYCDSETIDDFRPEDFDPIETIAALPSTSGTTGLPKVAALTHANFVIVLPYLGINFSQNRSKSPLSFVISPVQWVSAQVHIIISPIFRISRLQSSAPITQQHVYDIINKYRPVAMTSSPTFMLTLLRPDDRKRCDFSSLKVFYLGGSAVHKELIDLFKEAQPEARIFQTYGLSETSGICLNLVEASNDFCGTRYEFFEYKIVDVETQQEIKEANVTGELWVKGPTVFKGYWNRPKETAEVLTKDGWVKTGDLFYRDENWNFYFVDRMKLLLKYWNHQVSPLEIENVIRKHPKVLDVAVTGIRDIEYGDLPVACVVARDPSVTEQEIKDLVKETLTDTKQLRGGVIFLEELPTTPTGKVNTGKLRAMVNCK